MHDGSGQLATLGLLVHRVLHLRPHRRLFHDHPLLHTGTCLRPSGCAQLCRGLGGGAEIWQPARAQPAMSTWKTSVDAWWYLLKLRGGEARGTCTIRDSLALPPIPGLQGWTRAWLISLGKWNSKRCIS